MRNRIATAQEEIRLDAIAEHLGVKSRYPDSSFTADVRAACLARTAPIIKKMLPCTGEAIALGLGEHFRLVFEEVRGPNDVVKLTKHYLNGKGEIGFAQLRKELTDPAIDALLFERMNASASDPDQWVAVLNLQETENKVYWNRFHEFTHRIAEPPQQILPLKRHKFEATNPVEALIDSVASEFAFYEPAFRPLVERLAKRCKLSIDVIESIRNRYAPTASLQATLIAVVKYWPGPAAALIAEYRGRKHYPNLDQALRVTPQRYNDRADAVGLRFFDNMRVPIQSPVYEAFQTGAWKDGNENLEDWTTSTGDRLNAINVYTSARTLGKRVYAVVSS